MEKHGLTAGVIGGLGPAATVDFMARVIDATPAKSDQDHVRLLVDQNPKVPNRQDAVLRDGEDPGPILAAMAANLESAGADFLVMPCNSAHAYVDAITAATNVPFMSIVDASIEALPPTSRSIGVLDTPACQRAQLYRDALQQKGLQVVELTNDECTGSIQLVAAIKGGDRSHAIAEAMSALAIALVSRGADAIIVACTEIPLVLDDADVDVPLISSTDALARVTVAIARGDRPLPTR